MLPCIDVKTEAITDNNTVNLKYRAFLKVSDIFNKSLDSIHITPIF